MLWVVFTTVNRVGSIGNASQEGATAFDDASVHICADHSFDASKAVANALLRGIPRITRFKKPLERCPGPACTSEAAVFSGWKWTGVDNRLPNSSPALAMDGMNIGLFDEKLW